MNGMATWRDRASQEVQDDLDGLLDASLPFAQQMLAQHGDFLPYAVALDEHRETRMVSADPGLGEQPASREVLKRLRAGLRADRDGLCAAALVSDVRATGFAAIRVELEHRDGHAIAVLVPYKRKRLKRGFEYRPLVAAPSHQQVWPG
jgi:hypothetical protein